MSVRPDYEDKRLNLAVLDIGIILVCSVRCFTRYMGEIEKTP